MKMAGKCKVLWEKTTRQLLFHHKFYSDCLEVEILSSLYVAGVSCLSGYTIRKFKKIRLNWDKIFHIIFKVRWNFENGNMLHVFLILVIHWDEKQPDVSVVLPTLIKRLFRLRTKEDSLSFVAYIMCCPVSYIYLPKDMFLLVYHTWFNI